MHSSQPNLEKLQKHLIRRGDRIFKGWLILVGILSIFLGIFWFITFLLRGNYEYIGFELSRLFNVLAIPMVFLVIGFVHRMSMQILSSRGELVRADLHDSSMPHGSMMFREVFGLLGHLSMIGIAKLLPIHTVNFEFLCHGKKIKGLGLLFEGEEVDCDETGKAWVLAHPQFPRFIRWLVTKE